MRLDGFLGRAVSKVVNKMIETKLGYKADCELLSFRLSTNDDESYVRVSIDTKISMTDFNNLVEEATK